MRAINAVGAGTEIQVQNSRVRNRRACRCKRLSGGGRIRDVLETQIMKGSYKKEPGEVIVVDDQDRLMWHAPTLAAEATFGFRSRQNGVLSPHRTGWAGVHGASTKRQGHDDPRPRIQVKYLETRCGLEPLKSHAIAPVIVSVPEVLSVIDHFDAHTIRPLT